MRLFVIREIARHERKILFSGWGFGFCAIILNFTFFVSLLGGWSDYTTATRENRQTEQKERLRWLNQGVKGPHVAADQGVVVFVKLSPLSAFDPGVLPYTGSSALFGGHHEEILTNKAAEGTHSLHRLGSVSAAFVAQALLPLMLILLLHGTIAAERENGTLSQILSSGVSPAELVLGKLAGISVAVSIMIAPIFIVAGAVLRESNGDFIILALIHLAYSLAIVVLIVAISAGASTSRQSLVALLSGWTIGFMAAPVVITDVAQLLHPSPASLQYATAQMDAAGKMPTVEERRAAVRARLLKQYGVASLRDLPVDPIGVELNEEEQESEPLYGNLVGSVYDSYEQQNRLYEIGAVVTPLLAVQSLSMAISRTDFAAYRDFANAGKEYRAGMVKTLNDAIAYNPEYHNGTVFPGTDIIVTEAGADLWRRVPEFKYDAPGLAEVLARSWSSLLLLLAWMVFAAVFICVSTKRLSRM
jgi:ABC-2 type transport system permease protein